MGGVVTTRYVSLLNNAIPREHRSSQSPNTMLPANRLTTYSMILRSFAELDRDGMHVTRTAITVSSPTTSPVLFHVHTTPLIPKASQDKKFPRLLLPLLQTTYVYIQHLRFLGFFIPVSTRVRITTHLVAQIMCQFDVSRYLYPCHTFVYRLVRQCHQAAPLCRKVDLRQRHVRTEEPCRHPEVCNWCSSMEGLGKDAVIKHWNEAKSMHPTLHVGAPALPVPGSVPDEKFVEYDGTTYYVPPSDFQHRILPLLKEANAKRAINNSKVTKQDDTGQPVVVVTPNWEWKPTAAVGGLKTVVADHVAQPNIPLISKPTMPNRRNTNAATVQGNRPEAVYFIQPQCPLSHVPFAGHLSCEWKFNKRIDPQGRFITAVNHCWNVQKFPERDLYQPWSTSIQPQNFIYGGYYYPMYHPNVYSC